MNRSRNQSRASVINLTSRLSDMPKLIEGSIFLSLGNCSPRRSRVLALFIYSCSCSSIPNVLFLCVIENAVGVISRNISTSLSGVS